MTNNKLTAAVAAYFADLRRVRATGGTTGERSSYGPLAQLLNAVGAALKPKVFCVGELADQGAGHPDFGLYAAKQVQKGQPRTGQTPERGVVEVKAADDDAWLTAAGEQVSRYCARYRLVLVTNSRDFVLMGEDAAGRVAKLETFRLADSADDFHRKLEKPRVFAGKVGAGLGEYLCRALSHRAALAEPKDLAWLLASYARDGLARVEAAGDAPSLEAVRKALEEALGVRFEGEKGARFFRSTLVQTLFYGVFSAWVLWARAGAGTDVDDGRPQLSGGAGIVRFDWRTAVWHLRAPVLAALFQQLSQPGRLQRLGLVEVLDWTAAALDRVDHESFFARFNEGEAVPYFYEPFLEAFDPDLRKQLGVWYTPSEVVRYMVARVDWALKDDLGVAEGLAAENVYVLDPCCGTGAYLAEVLRRISANLEGQGLGALAGARVKQAATERVFGFEIMPAPFVVSHLQVGLTLQDLDAPLADDGEERPGVFLTNALTGWEPRTTKPLPFLELEEERDRAERVKQDTPILVILGNPPYNGFAGMAVDEERELSESYRRTKRVRRPEGQGLNDLYVRFFRMAERRIAEKTGRGVVCFISNYSWLDGLSFTGMRERYLNAFDSVRIDNLHGDRIVSEYSPDGRTSETVFALQGKSPGIKVGTSIALLSRSGTGTSASGRILYRDFHQARATERRQAMLESLDAPDINSGYSTLEPSLRLGLPFKPMVVSEDWFDWPSLPELFPASFPGVKTSRDGFVVDTDRDRLKAHIADYFDPALSHEEIARRYPAAMKTTARFDARAVREALLARGGPNEDGFIRHTYRPFDDRWLYWEADTKLLDEKRADYRPHVFKGNLWVGANKNETQMDFSHGTMIRNLGNWKYGYWGMHFFPVWLCEDEAGANRRPNLSGAARRYLERLGLGVEELFHHVLVTLHDPAYREANAGGLRMEWPRIPLPGWPAPGTAGASPALPPPASEQGLASPDSHAADALARSAVRGRQLAALLDADMPVPGVTTGTLRPELAAIAVPATTDGHNMAGDDFALTAGWGHYGTGAAVMPGSGRMVERTITREERAALSGALPTLGATTFDIHLNDRAFWGNVPAEIWNYKLGGYQVLKKWLSYRERSILDRPLLPEEVQHFTDTARRIAAMLLC